MVNSEPAVLISGIRSHLETKILPTDTGETLTNRLAEMGGQLILSTMEKLSAGTAVRTPQKEEESSYAKMLDKSLGCMDFHKTAAELERAVRALDPWPSAFTRIDGKNVKLLCTVESTKVHITKKGDKMCFAEISDGTGVMECVVFPDLFTLNSLKFTESSILIITGKLSVKDDRLTVICSSVASEREFDHLISTMRLCIKTTTDKASVPPELVRICDKYKGNTEICYYLTDIKKTVKPKSALKMFVSQESAEELEKIFSLSQIGLIH